MCIQNRSCKLTTVSIVAANPPPPALYTMLCIHYVIDSQQSIEHSDRKGLNLVDVQGNKGTTDIKVHMSLPALGAVIIR